MNTVAEVAADSAASPAKHAGRPDFGMPAAALIAAIATAASYYLSARLGFAMRFPESPHSVLWPPNAILLAGLLLMPRRLWWWSLAAVLPVHTAIALPAGLPWATSLGLYATNISQAVLGAALIHRFAGRYAAAGAHAEVIVFIVCGVFASPLLLSFADAAVAILTGWSANEYWRAWCLRFLSNAASVAIFVPPILATAEALRAWRRPEIWRMAEAFLVALCFAAVGSILVAGGHVVAGALPLLLCSLLPLLLWAVLRFGRVGASWALLGTVAVLMGSIWRWPVAIGGQGEILMLQAVFLLISIPILYVAALHGDLRRYTQALDTTTQRYRMATAAGSVGVWDWNPKTGELFIDPELKRTLGHEDHEIANRADAWMRHYHPEDGERVLRLARAYVRGEAAGFEDEHRMMHADSSIRWFLSRGALVRGEAGEPVRMIGTCIDITERRRIADELRSLEVLSGAVLASLSEHVAIIDRRGVVLAVNEAWLRSARDNADTHFARASPGVNYHDVCATGADDFDSARALAGIAAVLEGSRTEFRMEYGCPSPAGMRWFEMSVLPLRRSEGGAVVSHSDITRRKQAELESEQQRQELAHLTRVGILGELSGALAHELSQPLTAILSNAQAVQRYLAHEPLDLAELHAALKDIVDADKRAGDVIHRLRAMLKKGEAQLRPLDLNSVAGEVLDLAHSDFVAREVTVASKFAPDLPLVRGDRVQLQQVLLNLIMNGCEAMNDTDPKGRVLAIATASDDDGTVEVRVGDRGGGIPPDLRDRLFEPFVTTKKHGLGLGLSICRSIVAAHGGRIKVASNPDQGSTFSVSLPVQPGD